MRKFQSVLLILLLFLISSVATSVAGPRYYSSAYRNNFYPRPHMQYRNHYRSYNNHYYNSSDFWAPLGVGLLTGAVVGAIINQPPRQRTVVYNNPPPIIVHNEPLIIRRQYIQAPPSPELVLRRVRTTVELLNVRFGPGLDSSVTGQVQQGEILNVIGAAPDWLYIKTAAGQYGWVMSQYTHEAGGPVG